jgi:hypothetical protein
MAVLTTPAAPIAPALPQAAGPSCSLQRSGSLWQLGIEAQELTTAIGQLAEQLEADDDDIRAQALGELEAALLAEEGNKQALAAKADATCWVIEHLRGQAASRKSQAVEIDDEDALDPQWLSFSTTSKPDKAAIKEALKAGHLIPGAQLICRRSWRIY